MSAAALNVLTIAIDALVLPKVRLAKIDVERYERSVLCGMRDLLERDHPVLIVETGSPDTIEELGDLGSATRRLPGSSNVLCAPPGSTARSA